MPSTMDRMSTLDAEFFYAEHDNMPMHIGSVAVFDGSAPTCKDLMRLFEAKLPRVPRYRQVVRPVPFQLFRPAWADDKKMGNLKDTHQAADAEILTGMLGFAAPMWLALGTQAAFRTRQPLVQTVTTNVPGPRAPLYVLGRRLTALHPYVPIGNAVRLSGIRRGLAELSGRAAR